MHCEPIEFTCPLCRAVNTKPYFRDRREFFLCLACRLVFVDPRYHLSREEEKATYDNHENSSDDPRYRRFLSRLFVPLCERLTPRSCGLDFGSGPGPTLSVMFEEAGHAMRIYDPFYAPDIQPLLQRYDFITASEVLEHLHHPRQDLETLWSCLKPGGWLGIMTKRVIDKDAFSRWHYKNDPTHVCFYAVETFRWLAESWNATLTITDNDVVLFQKSA